jgi:hypothetical protein
MKYRLLTHWLGFTLASLAAVTFGGWFATVTNRMFEYWIHHQFALVWNGQDLIILSVSVLCLLGAAYYFHWVASSPLSVVEPVASRHPGLILFLSQSLGGKDILDVDGQETKEWVAFQASFPAAIDDFAAQLKAAASPADAGVAFGPVNWCMPMVAIAYNAAEQRHGQPLQRIVAICSADSGPRQNGSWRQAEFFEQMVKRLFDRWGTAGGCPDVRFPSERGVDFHNLLVLANSVRECYRCLAEDGIASVVVDITGGTKECSIAGAAQALEPGRKLQYVSTADRVVRHYDVTYQYPKTSASGGQ